MRVGIVLVVSLRPRDPDDSRSHGMLPVRGFGQVTGSHVIDDDALSP